MGNSIVFVDWRVADIDALIAGLPPGAEVDIIDGTSDGLDQIAALLQGRTGIDAIHIISHGSSGSVYLGNSVIDAAALATHAGQLEFIGKSLTESGDILLYGCNVAAGDAGMQFIGSLAHATGADVAASTDWTGGTIAGGNGTLESQTGIIQTTELDLASYGHTLDTFSFAANAVQIAGLHYETALYNFGPDVSNFALGLKSSAGSIYTNASLNTDFTLDIMV